MNNNTNPQPTTQEPTAMQSLNILFNAARNLQIKAEEHDILRGHAERLAKYIQSQESQSQQVTNIGISPTENPKSSKSPKIMRLPEDD